jgi:hypothetical protein
MMLPPEQNLLQRLGIPKWNNAAARLRFSWAKRTFSRAHLTSGISEPAWLKSFHFALYALISQPDAILERGAGAPAQFGEAADIEQFARRAVGLRGVEADPAATSGVNGKSRTKNR